MTSKPPEGSKKKRAKRVHPIITKTYLPRTGISIGFTLIIAATLLPEQVGVVVAVAIVNLLVPHLANFYASRRPDTLKAGMWILQADAVWVGLNIAVVSFRLLPAFAMATMLMGTLLLMGGWRVAKFILLLPVGALLGLTVFDFRPLAEVGLYGELISYAVICGYIFGLALASNGTLKDAIMARKSLRKKNKQVIQQAQTLRSINEITRAVNASLRLDDVVTALMSGLQKIFSFDLMGVALINEESNALILDREVGTGVFDLEALQGIAIPLDDKRSAFAHAVQNRQPVYVPKIEESDVELMSAVDRSIYDAAPSKSLLVLPLVVENHAIGTISFSNSQEEFHLDTGEIERIEEYVAQLATAIRNARLFEEARIARQAALAATETKSQFLANMSHELRTPMNAVIGYSEMLEEEAEDEGLTDFIPDLKKIQSAGRHLLELINGILDLSKIEANKMELYLEDADVGQLVDGVASTVKPLVAKNENTLEVDRDAELGSMHADVTKIRQSLLNLLSNASKFTEKGTVRLSAHRETSAAGDWLTFAVGDTGIGMSVEQLSKLFQPFTQADASTTRKYGGTGLGLTISKRFCEMMGGDIIATSTPGEGSTFTIRIPAIVAEKIDVAAAG